MHRNLIVIAIAVLLAFGAGYCAHPGSEEKDKQIALLENEISELEAEFERRAVEMDKRADSITALEQRVDDLLSEIPKAVGQSKPTWLPTDEAKHRAVVHFNCLVTPSRPC